MRSIIKERFLEAKKGKKFFLSIAKKQLKQIDKKTAYIFFFEKDDELNHFGLLYLNDFLDFSSYDSAIIISSDTTILDTAKKYCTKIDNLVKASEKEILDTISYFVFRNTKSDCYFISLDRPYGRRGSNILGKNGLTKEQIVGIGIYHIIPFRKIDDRSL